MKTTKLLLLDDARGIYIPQAFAQNFRAEDWGLNHADWVWQVLLSGPEHEQYWEAWDEVLDKACHVVTEETKTKMKHGRWRLDQDGALFARHEDDEEEEAE